MYRGRGYYILRGGEWPDMVVQVVLAKSLVMMLDLSQPRLVPGERLKDIHG